MDHHGYSYIKEARRLTSDESSKFVLQLLKTVLERQLTASCEISYVG